MSLEQSISEVAAAIRYFADKAFPSKLPRPEPFTIKLISERKDENDMDLLKYEGDLPPVPPGTDVAKQALTVSADGVAQPEVELAKDATVTSQFEVPQGSRVKASLVYVDDAGNRSAPREQEFDALDTIPPSAPGPFGEFRVVDERTVPDEPPIA